MPRSRAFCYPGAMADEEEGEEESEEKSEEPSEKAEPEKAEPEKAEPEKKADAPAAPATSEPTKPVSKTVEWGIALAMMVILIGFLFMMIYLMRSARSAVM